MLSVVSAVRDIARLREINQVLVRHGFAELAGRLGLRVGKGSEFPPPPSTRRAEQKNEKARKSAGDEAPDSEALVLHEEQRRGEQERESISTAERVRLVAMDLGASFVKMGQIASTRPDVLPADWIAELRKLQDEVNPVPFEDIKEVIEVSLGAPLSELFESFDEVPLAAASIAQAHRAVLKHPEGPQQVVVKVQRPRVAQTVARDLELLHLLARFVERTIAEAHIYQPTALVDQFDRAITAEMDFNQEADNAERFAKNFADHPHAFFPKVYRAASSKRVITLEYIDGHKIDDAIEHHGFDGSALAKAAAAIVIKMIFEDGFFHADPHPGNILLFGRPEEMRIGIIDLGMVGRLSPEMRDRTIDMMIAATRKDHQALADALYAVGTPTEKIDMKAYRAEVERLAEKHLHKPLKQIDVAQLIADVVKGATRFGLEIPSDFLLVGKAMMTMEGVAKDIDPELNVFEEARPFFIKLLRQRYAPERVASDVWRGIGRLSTTAYDLPQQVREVMDDLRVGRLTLQTRDAASTKTMERLGRRVFAGLLVSALLLSGAWLLPQGSEARTLGIVLLVLAAVGLLWHLVRDWRGR